MVALAPAAPPALASDLAGALDPVLMSRRAGIDPDEWQQRVLRSGSRRLLLNAARQSGKSTTVATLALHTALYEPKALVLIVSPSERQSGETFRKIVHVYRALGRPVAPTSEGALHLELANGSRVLALPGREETSATSCTARCVRSWPFRVAAWWRSRPRGASGAGGMTPGWGTRNGSAMRFPL